MSDKEACLVWIRDGYVRKIRVRPSVPELGGIPGVLYTSYDRLAVGPEVTKVIPLDAFEQFLNEVPGKHVDVDIRELR